MSINLIAVLSRPDDPEILSEENFESRILLFEEYANGGCAILDALIGSSTEEPRTIIMRLLEDAIPSGGNGKAADITGAIEALSGR